VAVGEPLAYGLNRVCLGIDRQGPAYQIDVAADEVFPLVRVIAELRLAEVRHDVPTVRPSDAGNLGVERVNIEVLDAVSARLALEAVQVVQRTALAERDDQHSGLVDG
jgi:hypothetical protein